jgi:hypothetical protein
MLIIFSNVEIWKSQSVECQNPDPEKSVEDETQSWVHGELCLGSESNCIVTSGSLAGSSVKKN